ncbi:hypothetical protein [Pseudomonas sp. FSL R10-0399]|uniref:hypothetical protein n=1 Tax=Pseudomonas sp. FSL R10-0399 TaxID=2662194 RepID=UPI00211398A7|nr:hypothetical protein [Pseudomonas sp. FSL R10-0399]
MTSHYTLGDVKEIFYQYQLALEASVIELTLWAEAQAATDAGENICGALDTSAENAGLINQALALLRNQKSKTRLTAYLREPTSLMMDDTG